MSKLQERDWPADAQTRRPRCGSTEHKEPWECYRSEARQSREALETIAALSFCSNNPHLSESSLRGLLAEIQKLAVGVQRQETTDAEQAKD